jgi:hypothetical protein
MDSWLGHTRQDLIMNWGPPQRTASDGGTGEILVYSRHVYMNLPSGLINYYEYKMMYINSEGRIYHWMIQNQQVPPTQIDLNVYKRN